MTCKELRIKLHEECYHEGTLPSIAARIVSGLNCVEDYTIKPALSQIELHLNTASPSEIDFSSAITQALIEFISACGIEYSGDMTNMYNILISHVEGDKSTVVIML